MKTEYLQYLNNTKISFTDIDTEMDVISESTHLTGTFSFSKITRIEGKVDGKIKSTGLLIIEDRASIKADLECNMVVINGSFNGNIKADKIIIIEEKAEIKGDIESPQLIIKNGAKINGSVKMVKFHPNTI